MTVGSYHPDWIPPPGATVRDLLGRKGLDSTSTIAARLGHQRSELLLEGHLRLDPEIAAVLSKVVGLSAQFWLERERLYRAALDQREFEATLLRELPLGEMRKWSFVERRESHAEAVADVVRFFGKDDVNDCRTYIDQLPRTVRQKASPALASQPGPLAVWIRAGEIQAELMNASPWDIERLRQLIPEFRKLTRTADPAKYLPRLRYLCGTCGVALVVMRPPDGCRARGAVRFLSESKAMLLLSYRHLSDDQFWFSFFHELGHMILHPQEDQIDDDWASRVTAEDEADQFAADALIPPKVRDRLRGLRDARAIIAFARQLGVSRGIVVGRMQHDGIVPFDRFNRLKAVYEWDHLNRVRLKRG